MGILDIFRRSKNKNIINIAEYESRQELSLALNFFALQTGINLISSAIVNCEFETVLNYKKTKGDEYFLWNYEPNPNQNKVEFISKLVDSLIWHNECLIVEQNDYLYIADSFSKKEYAFYPPTFSNVVIGDLTLNKQFSGKDVMYMTYNNKDVTALLCSLLDGYKKLIAMSMAKYKRAGGRKGVVESGLNPQNDEAWNKALADLYGDKFKKYFNEENALVVLPNGQNYTEISGDGSKKSTSDVTDIINLTNEVFTQVGHALHIAPSLLKGEVADLDSATESTLTFAVKPVINIIESEIIRKRFGSERLRNGSYLKINTGGIIYINPFKNAVNADKLIADSVYNADEIRVKFGDLALNTPESTEYVRTKNYERAERRAEDESETESEPDEE